MEEKLPSVAKAHMQSRESAVALACLLAPESFILHPITVDYGIDYKVEIVDGGKATNIIFDLQLKSQENAKINVDKEFISCSLKTTALAYLVTNKASLALFVIYDSNVKQLYAQWTHLLIGELDTRNSAWRNQETVTVRMPISEVLDSAKAVCIHDAVIQYNRKIQKAISDSTRIEIFVAQTDTITPSTPDNIDEKLRFLEKHATNLIAANRHDFVISEYLKISPIKWMSSAKHLLILANAYDHAGNPLQVLVQANAIDSVALNEDERFFLNLLKLNAQISLEQISATAYRQELKELCSANTGHMLSSSVLLQLYLPDIVRQESRDDIKKILTDAEALCKDTLEKDIPLSYALHLHLLLGNLQYHGFMALLMHDTMDIRMMDDIKHPISIDQRTAFAKEALQVCDMSNRNFATVLSSAEGKFPDIYARALLMSSENILFKVMSSKVLKTDFSITKDLEVALSNIPRISKLFIECKMNGLLFQTVRHHADILYMLGRIYEAENLMLTTVRPAANSLGLPDSAAEPIVYSTLRAFEKSTAIPLDVTLAQLSEAEKSLFENRIQRSLGIPEERLPHLHADLQAVQLIAQERSNWCQHIEMLVELSQYQNPETAYTYEPNRWCVCKLLNNESRTSVNISELVIEFKNDHCKRCHRRAPLNSRASDA